MDLNDIYNGRTILRVNYHNEGSESSLLAIVCDTYQEAYDAMKIVMPASTEFDSGYAIGEWTEQLQAGNNDVCTQYKAVMDEAHYYIASLFPEIAHTKDRSTFKIVFEGVPQNVLGKILFNAYSSLNGKAHKDMTPDEQKDFAQIFLKLGADSATFTVDSRHEYHFNLSPEELNEITSR